MKKIISLLVVAALMLSLFSVSAFAEGKKPEPTGGPTEDSFIYGGARLGTYEPATHRNRYIVNYNYSEGGGLVIDNEAIPGATYDRGSNTLTIDNVHQKANQLFIWYMGDDFKLNVVGENEFGIIYVYNYFNFHSTSLNIIGTGTLTVNQELINDDAIHMVAEGDSTMHLDIADSVSVHLYAKEKEGGEQAAVVTLGATTITPKEGGAITVGGKAAPEAQYEQIVDELPEYINVVRVEDVDRDVTRGTQLRSKSDPDGVYVVVDVMDGVTYVVARLVYVDELGAWARDESFAEDWYAGQRYTKAGLEAEYDYVYGQAPTLIQYMQAYRLDYIGNEGVKMTKDGEPDAVYVGEPNGPTWDGDHSHPYYGNYTIHKVVWNDNIELCVEDASFDEIDLMAAELEENGYHIITEDVQVQNELTVWANPAPYDGDNWETTRDVLRQKSDPEALFVQIGTYTDSDGETGIVMYRVHYDPENDVHYIQYGTYTSDEHISVSDTQLDDGTADYYYDIETVNQSVKVRYLPAGDSISWYLSNAVQLEKNDDPDTVYAYTQTTHYFGDGTSRIEYEIIKLNYSDKLGCYIEDEDYYGAEFYDLNDLDSMGYKIVMSEQPLDFVTKGNVFYSEYPVYTDNDGGTYYADYNDHVYRYTDKDIITISGEDYYCGTLMPDLSIGDLNDTIHEVVSDNYDYWIPGTEYHHVAGEQPEYIEYDLWVNGERLNSDRLRIPCGKGVAIYDPAEKTLTLDNVEITKGVEEDMLGTGVLSYIDHLTVVIKGDCTITETGGDGIGTYNNESYQIGDVIYPMPYDITIIGDGTLTITESAPMYGYGLYCTGNLILDGVKLNISSAAAGVWASDLKMKDVEADIQTSSWYSGIVVNRGNFAFDNSTVNAESGEGAGLLLGSDKEPSILTVSSGSLSLKGKLGVQGVVDKSIITVNGGTLSVEGSNAAFDETFLADNAKNIIMGEGIGVTSGDVNGKSAVISAVAAGYILGDVDGDDEVTIVDAAFIQRHVAGIPIPFELNQAVANVDGDTAVGIMDATYIQRWLVNHKYNDSIGKPIG